MFKITVVGGTSMDTKMIEQVKRDFEKYQQLNTDNRFLISEQEQIQIYPIVGNTYNTPYCWSYFPQDLWGARKVYENNPKVHYDVASSGWSFIPNIMSFRKDVVSIDIRPMKSDIEGLTFICANATNMEGIKDNSVESLSALCSIEHFGLGRYGDPIEPDAWRQALASFNRVIIPGGRLYIAVCIQINNELHFNGQRVFEPFTIIENVPDMDLLELAITDNGFYKKLIWTTKEGNCLKQQTASDFYESLKKGGIGLFEFAKRKER